MIWNMNDLVDWIKKIESLFEGLDSQIEEQIQERQNKYYTKSFFSKLFSGNKEIEKSYQEWNMMKRDVISTLQDPNRHSELPAILNLYALNSAILAAKLDNPTLAQKAEKIRIISEEVRNKML